MTEVASTITNGQSQAVDGDTQSNSAPTLKPLQRVHPFPGMRIDVDTWRDAHDYHRAQARLHQRALHGTGIVFGLEVIPGASINALLVQPGVAVDGAGNLIVVDREQVHRIAAATPGTIYLALRFHDQPIAPADNPAGPPARVLESFVIEERTLPPADAELELVRIDFDPRAAVRAPRNAAAPERGELDYRGRVRLGVAVAGAAVASSAPLQFPPSSVSGGQLTALSTRLDEVTRQMQTLSERRDVVATPAPTPVTDGDSGPLTDEWRTRIDGLDRRFSQVSQVVEQLDTSRQAIVRELQSVTDRSASTAAEVERVWATVVPLEQKMMGLGERFDTLAVERNASTDAAGELRLVVARYASPGWNQHAEGLRLLARELRAIAGVPTRILEPVDLGDADQVDLLYLTGTSRLDLADREIRAIARVLDGGGVVLGEGCAAGPNGDDGAKDFAFSFIDLGQRLGRRLARVARDSRLLQARYLFGDPPPGLRPARVLEDSGMVCSDADYGCAWQGGSRDQPLPRATIRDALEFGTNLTIYRQTRLAGAD